jgi:hypothetical protein
MERLSGVASEQPGSGVPAAKSQVPASTSGALAGCTWDSCTGKDAGAMGCLADAYVLYNQNLDTSYASKLYYSPSCEAAWAQAEHSCSGICHLSIFYTQPFGFGEKQFSAQSATAPFRTLMSSFNNSVKSCVGDWPDGQPADWDEQGTGRGIFPNYPGACSQWF